MNASLISVVMPVYNAEETLREAALSITGQTHRNFELIIVDDGSSDRSPYIAEEIAEADSRVRLVRQPNGGVAVALNHGFSLATGKFVARMDADDVAVPGRLALQLREIETRRLDVLGSAIRLYGGQHSGRIIRFPIRDADTKFWLVFKSPFAHPTMLFRRSSIDSRPYLETALVEDYQLWTRLALTGARLGNTEEACLTYRVHNMQVSTIRRKESNEEAWRLAASYAAKMYGCEPNDVYAMRRGMRYGATAANVVRWSLVAHEVGDRNGVTPVWIERALFALALRCEWAPVALRQLKKDLSRANPSVLSRRLSLLYALKTVPMSNSAIVERVLLKLRGRLPFFAT